MAVVEAMATADAVPALVADFLVILNHRGDTQYGWDTAVSGLGLVVNDIHAGGLIAFWNRTVPPVQVVRRGDFISSCNTVRSGVEMQLEMARHGMHVMQVHRRAALPSATTPGSG